MAFILDNSYLSAPKIGCNKICLAQQLREVYKRGKVESLCCVQIVSQDQRFGLQMLRYV